MTLFKTGRMVATWQVCSLSGLDHEPINGKNGRYLAGPESGAIFFFIFYAFCLRFLLILFQLNSNFFKKEYMQIIK